jgi:hypothetical protein
VSAWFRGFGKKKELDTSPHNCSIRQILIVLVCACIASSAGADNATSDAKVEHIFQVVDALDKSFPVQRDSLEKLTGEKFERDPNAFRLDSIKPGAGVFSSVRACGPKKGMAKDAPCDEVLLEIKPDTPIEIGQVEKHFGKFSKVITYPYTDLPIDKQPNHYVYKRSWGLLTFECGPQSHLVRQISINAERRSR